MVTGEAPFEAEAMDFRNGEEGGDLVHAWIGGGSGSAGEFRAEEGLQIRR